MNIMLLTVADVARRLNVCEKTILNWHKSGKLVPSTTTSRGWRLYRPCDIEELKRIRERKAGEECHDSR